MLARLEPFTVASAGTTWDGSRLSLFQATRSHQPLERLRRQSGDRGFRSMRACVDTAANPWIAFRHRLLPKLQTVDSEKARHSGSDGLELVDTATIGNRFRANTWACHTWTARRATSPAAGPKLECTLRTTKPQSPKLPEGFQRLLYRRMPSTFQATCGKAGARSAPAKNPSRQRSFQLARS